MGLTTLEPTASVDDVCDVIARDGGVIVKDFIDSELLDAIKADLLPELERVGWGQDDFAGAKTRRLGALFKHSPRMTDLITHPLFYGAAERYLQLPTPVWFGEERAELVANIQVGVTQLIDIHPGEGSQPLHRDDAVWQWRHPEGGRQARVQIMLAVTDFTADNGGTLVIPGSHLWDDERGPREEETVPTEMTAGSALIWLGATYHAGGTNNTDISRTGLTLTLDLAYLRQEENQYLSVPLDVVKGLPDRVQRLLGYEASPPFMGWIEVDGVMTDPHHVLEDDPSSAKAAATF
ncbi:phytanoyl-CoA dioxygenase family protein [Streptomyces sp. NBC_00988]|uniref:phytanoyl-CoA dioxygenase family protein n=1 Tax=Streptomyces sp. NBC_00988 TaxID=2903704 RepID=UPI00386BDE46|nr:phytanoyl-CoA dioxygenase family protein [Streptomyces sp. NBC_00988]